MRPIEQSQKPTGHTPDHASRKLMARYGIAGLINTLVGFLVYSAAILFTPAEYWLANLFAAIAGVICGFILARIFVFKGSNTSIFRSGPRYLITIAIQYVVSTIIIGILVHFGVAEIVAYLIALPIIIGLSYILQKNWVFPENTSPKE
jgi:putative flippase GtrA